MKIIGFQKQSLMEYPGKISAILFTPGCNFRCPFCHNYNIIIQEGISKLKVLDYSDVRDFLISRFGFLDGVVISGGEPTLQNDLYEVICDLKKIGYFIKLDTNGTNSNLLKKLIDEKLVDYISMDIKSSLEFKSYNKAIGNILSDEMLGNVKKSISIIMTSDIDYEFRTTLVPSFIELDDVLKIANFINGAKRYTIQNYLSENVYFEDLKKIKPYNNEEIKIIISKINHNLQIKEIKTKGFNLD